MLFNMGMGILTGEVEDTDTLMEDLQHMIMDTVIPIT